jgi:hypothetical protein
MTKKKFISGLTLIVLVLPLIYALDYGSGSYGSTVYGGNESSGLYCGDGICNNGETCSSCSADCGDCGGGSSSGGGQSPTIKYQCTQDSDCKTNQYCFNHTCYEAECFDDSVCNIDEGETCWDYRCVKLFDMEIINFQSPVNVGEFFNFTYFVKSVAEINGDVQIRFWIEQDNGIVTSGQDTIYLGSFDEKKKTKSLFLPEDVTSGTYTFYIEVTYGNYTASAHRTIQINVNEGVATIDFSSASNNLRTYIISALIGLGAFIVCLIFYIERKKINKGVIAEGRWIRKHRISLLVLALFIIIGLLIYYLYWYEPIAELLVKAVGFVKKMF